MAVTLGGTCVLFTTTLDNLCHVVYSQRMKKAKSPFEKATEPYYAALFDIVSMLTDKAKAGSIDAARELRLMILEQKSGEPEPLEDEPESIKSALEWTQPLESARVAVPAHALTSE